MAEPSSAKIVAGHKLRRLRSSLKLTQAEMANELGISASYLNLLENNARPVTVPILYRLGRTYDFDLRDFADDDSLRITSVLKEVFADQVFEDVAMSRRDIQLLANQHPSAAEALISLHRSYDLMRDAAYGGEQKDENFLSPRPIESVRELLETSSNYFPELEEAAADCVRRINLSPGKKLYQLIEHLEQKYDVTTRILPTDVMGNLLRDFNQHRKQLLLSESLKESQRLFQVAAQIGLLGYSDSVNNIATSAKCEDEDTENLLRMTLSSYFAGAVMMPYGTFLEAAQETRHDLDILSSRFTASFEQVCHRLTTLKRSDERGIPFFFLRVNEAGYISKRLSAGEMEFARNGGGCGRWIPHQAFRNSGAISVQAASLEEGQKLLTVARTCLAPRTQPAHYGTPMYVVALGCDLKFAKNICYADSFVNAKTTALTPIGLGCHVCERQNCQHRGSPPRGHKLRFDISRRHSGLFTSG